jgi:hypothetical protein
MGGGIGNPDKPVARMPRVEVIAKVGDCCGIQNVNQAIKILLAVYVRQTVEPV